MVGVVALLAAVTAVFLLGFASPGETPPQMSFAYDYDYQQNLTITAGGGNSFGTDRVTVDAFNSSQVVFQGVALGEFDGATWTEADNVTHAARVTAGDQVILGDIRDPTFELNIVWTAPGGDSSAIIGSATGPTP
jgi:Protein of unknown function (DUF1628).